MPKERRYTYGDGSMGLSLIVDVRHVNCVGRWFEC
jgi:hypothetical protein